MRQLVQLYNQGVLSDAVYQAAKRRILEQDRPWPDLRAELVRIGAGYGTGHQKGGSGQALVEGVRQGRH